MIDISILMTMEGGIITVMKLVMVITITHKTIATQNLKEARETLVIIRENILIHMIDITQIMDTITMTFQIKISQQIGMNVPRESEA